MKLITKLLTLAAIMLLPTHTVHAFYYMVGNFNQWNTNKGLLFAPVVTIEPEAFQVDGHVEFKVIESDSRVPGGYNWYGGFAEYDDGFLITEELTATPIQLYLDYGYDAQNNFVDRGGSNHNFIISKPGKYMVTLSFPVIIVNKIGEVGDLNGDGKIDVSDVNIMIDVVLGKTNQQYPADLNGDGKVDVTDVNSVIDIVLGKGSGGGDEPATQTFTVNGVSFKMVGVEGGTFMMGASDDDTEASNTERPAHQVTLSDFSIGETEVTQELWVAVMGSNPSWFNGYGNSDYGSYHSTYNYGTNLQRPVECVTWNDCQIFITKLNALTGKTFRLPTEAEWEYAARGGNKSKGYKYAGSNTLGDVALYWNNSPSWSSGTQSVAAKSPNELVLYDMSGNVWEWCQDWYGSYSSNAQTNPTGPSSGSSRVFRGGCYSSDGRSCRVSIRLDSSPDDRVGGLGLRLAM